jgi:hypothetical protein
MNWMIMSLKVDEELAEDLRMFFFETYKTRDSQEDLNQFFDMLPPSLQADVQDHIYSQALAPNCMI